jgi:site-specific DNA-methyltransferase (adenine-specific)
MADPIRLVDCILESMRYHRDNLSRIPNPRTGDATPMAHSTNGNGRRHGDAPSDRLIRGDCVAGLARLPDGCVDLAFADPPFNIGYEYDIYRDRRACDDYLAWSKAWIAQVARALKPDGTFWLAIGDEYAAELKVIAHREVGLHLRSWVVWYYTFGVHCSKKFARSHVHLFYFVKDPRRFTFHDAAIRVPSARQLVYADRRANPAGRLPDDTWILRPQQVPGGFADDEDTWYVPRVCGTFRERAGWHGCQMPEQVLGRIIRACSDPGDLVLDPFAGSGTTLTVARKLHRRYLGFELSEDYADRVEARLALAEPGQPLEGGEAPSVAAVPSRRR